MFAQEELIWAQTITANVVRLIHMSGLRRCDFDSCVYVRTRRDRGCHVSSTLTLCR